MVRGMRAESNGSSNNSSNNSSSSSSSNNSNNSSSSNIKFLERITVRGFASPKDFISVVKYGGEYYCIDDPLEYSNDKKIAIIGEADSLEEVYKYYIAQNARHSLNPYILLMLYKEGRLKWVEADEVLKVLARNITISNGLLELLNDHLLALEKKGKPISISIAVLDAIARAEAYIEQGLSKEDLLRIIEEQIRETDNAIYYPAPHVLIALLEQFYEEEREEEARKKEEEEEIRRRREALGVTVTAYTYIYKPIAVTVGSLIEGIGSSSSTASDSSSSSSDIENDIESEGENEKEGEGGGIRGIEQSLADSLARLYEESKDKGKNIIVVKVFAFSFSKEEAEKVIEREAERFISSLKKYGVEVERK